MPAEQPPPAPIAKVSVSPSAPIVVPVPITITPPAPPPAEPPAPVPPIRATTPHLQAQCVLQSSLLDEGATCDWDRGFPAISADGKTIVVEHVVDDGGRGNPNLTIQFIDAASSKITKSVPILDANEYEEQASTTSPLYAKVARRVAKAQKLIDAGAYRTLEALSPLDQETGTKLRVDARGSKLRIVDSERHLAVLHADYDAKLVYPKHEPDPDRECSGLAQAGDLPSWWDATTRTIVTDVSYVYGGCLCGGHTTTFVRRVESSARDFSRDRAP